MGLCKLQNRKNIVEVVWKPKSMQTFYTFLYTFQAVVYHNVNGKSKKIKPIIVGIGKNMFFSVTLLHISAES